MLEDEETQMVFHTRVRVMLNQACLQDANTIKWIQRGLLVIIAHSMVWNGELVSITLVR